MRQVYTCSVFWLLVLVGSESAFVFVHFVGAEELVMIRLEHAGQVPPMCWWYQQPAYQVRNAPCVWVNFTSSDLPIW